MTQTASALPCPSPIIPGPASGPHQVDAAHEAERTVQSAELLAGRLAVTIDHLGMRYVLRATRSGKLILTK